MAGRPLKDFVKRELSGFAMFVLVVIIVLSNILGGSTGTKAANERLAKTVAAGLISSDFDTNIEDALIEEGLTPAILAEAKQERYTDEYPMLEKNDALEQEEDDSTGNYYFNENGDAVFKPYSTFIASSGTNGSIAARTEIIEYSVQVGDTVSSIASNFGITINTILWANNLSAYSLIRPGDTLTILPYSGLMYTVKSGDTISKIASAYDIEAEEIAKQNKLGEGGLKIGQKLILPGAKKINTSSVASAIRRNNSYTGVSVIKDLVKAPAASSKGGSMVWPAVGYRITQYFSWRHNGIDIGNKVGTAIYAAEAGTVEIARGGWNGGYGNTILINHGGGKKTRYGHLSKLYVKAGEKVARGENIGAMGSTGRSTGPHLHFEIIINGTRYNPLNYVK